MRGGPRKRYVYCEPAVSIVIHCYLLWASGVHCYPLLSIHCYLLWPSGAPLLFEAYSLSRIEPFCAGGTKKEIRLLWASGVHCYPLLSIVSQRCPLLSIVIDPLLSIVAQRCPTVIWGLQNPYWGGPRMKSIVIYCYRSIVIYCYLSIVIYCGPAGPYLPT